MSDVVGHFTWKYLYLTQTFVYQYLTNHERYDPFVCAQVSDNLELFEFEPREVFMDLPRWSPRFLTYGILAKLGIRDLSDTFYPYVLDQRDPDIVHAHFGPMGVSLSPYRTPDRKLVTSFYGEDASRLVQAHDELGAEYERLFDRGDLFLAEGPAMQEKLVDLGCPEDKIAIQRIGIDTARITQQYPERDATTTVLMVGRFVEKKGLPDGIEAFASAFGDEDAELRIVGGEGEYTREHLERIAESHGIRDQVTFTGYLEYEEYLDEIHECTLLLTPSKVAASGDSEGGAPTVLLEAQASGKPIVSTTHADIPYVVADGETGLLAPPGDVSGLAERLRQVASDHERMRELGRAGVERMRDRHDIRKLSKQLEKRYDSLR